MSTDTPMVWPDAPNVRKTDPATSHHAADRAVSRQRTLRAVSLVLSTADAPMTSEDIYETARLIGFYCTPQRVRTVLAEGKRDGIFQSVEGGKSRFGNPCHMWTLKEQE